MAVYQSMTTWLMYRYREQARSHRTSFFLNFSPFALTIAAQ
jgi:hypothetical protein